MKQSIRVDVVNRPRRQCLIKRGRQASHYMEYVSEVGCDVWDELKAMRSSFDEPVCLWLPEELMEEGTSRYVQGREFSLTEDVSIPDGYDLISLEEATFLRFQGEPYEDEKFSEAIACVQSFMDQFDPAERGFKWDDNEPRIQLEPIAERGYVELRAVRPLK